jgi:hypothetical protein
MKYDDKFPDAPFDFEHQEPGVCIWKGLDIPKECMWCHSLTAWVSITLDNAVCSEECDRAIWDDFSEELMRCNARFDVAEDNGVL